jgi:hypothetical protein
MKKILLSLLLLSVSTFAFGATYYISPSGNDSTGNGSLSAPWKSFAKCFGEMSAADELILLDGTYSNDIGTGYINNTNGGAEPLCGQPPSGTDINNMTIVRALNEGSVTVHGTTQSYRSSLLLGASDRKDSYIQIQGIVFDTGGGYMWNTSYCTVKDCGFHKISKGSGAVFACGVSEATHGFGNDYNLFEDCWFWGQERLIVSNYNSDYNIWRRCVVRGDGCSTMDTSGNPNVGFTVYDSSYVSVQNMIIVDRILDGGYPFGSFASAQHTSGSHYLGPVEWLGCIALNSADNGFCFGADNANSNTYTLRNCISWDSASFNIQIPGDAYDIYLRNITMGVSSATSVNNGDNLRVAPEVVGGDISNLIAYSSERYAINSVVKSSYVCVFNVVDNFNQTTPTVGVMTSTDPISSQSLKYLIRIEEGSLLKGTGDGGEDYGANVIYKYGVDGTRFGDSGYNSLSSSDLWPFPNEDLIKDFFAASSTRGFCTEEKQLNNLDEVTLTSYIWEYLGNPIPADIYSSTFSAPSNLVAMVASSTTITLNWSNNASLAEGISIERKSTGSYVPICNVSSNTVSYTDINLDPKTTYYYRVRAYKEN